MKNKCQEKKRRKKKHSAKKNKHETQLSDYYEVVKRDLCYFCSGPCISRSDKLFFRTPSQNDAVRARRFRVKPYGCIAPKKKFTAHTKSHFITQS